MHVDFLSLEYANHKPSLRFEIKIRISQKETHTEAHKDRGSFSNNFCLVESLNIISNPHMIKKKIRKNTTSDAPFQSNNSIRPVFQSQPQKWQPKLTNLRPHEYYLYTVHE